MLFLLRLFSRFGGWVRASIGPDCKLSGSGTKAWARGFLNISYSTIRGVQGTVTQAPVISCESHSSEL